MTSAMHKGVGEGPTPKECPYDGSREERREL